MHGPHWLDDREERAWRRYLRMHTRLSGRLNRELQRGAGLSEADYEVLVNLSEAPAGQMRAFELSRSMQWEKSRLSHQLTRMAGRGLVERVECESDGRGAHVVITGAGRSVIEAAAPRHVEDVRRYFLEPLTPAQLDCLTEIADSVLSRLDEADESDGCG